MTFGGFDGGVETAGVSFEGASWFGGGSDGKVHGGRVRLVDAGGEGRGLSCFWFGRFRRWGDGSSFWLGGFGAATGLV